MKPVKNKQSKEETLKITSADQLADELRKARKAQKITTEKLAQFADTSRYSILNFENHKRELRLSTLLKLLKLCNIELQIKVKR